MKSLNYYDNTQLLSYDRFMNFTIGHRGVGKSYDFKTYCIKWSIKTGKQCAWVRRYKSETKEATAKFLDDLNLKEFGNHKLAICGTTLYCDGKPIIFFFTLSVSSKYKSTPYPNVDRIIFDEFIIDKSTFKYINGYDEPSIFLDLVFTIFRKRPNTKVFCIANAISFTNPYFLYFNIQKTNKRFFKTKDICVEHYKNQHYIDEMYDTPFGRLVKNTPYGNYAIENEYVHDTNSFIEDKSKDSKFRFAIKYNGIIYGIWRDLSKGLLYISDKYDSKSNLLFTLKSEEHDVNFILLHKLKNNYTSELKLAFNYGKVRFKNMHIKNMFFEILTLI